VTVLQELVMAAENYDSPALAPAAEDSAAATITKLQRRFI